jgi:hypothetical protein
MGAAILIPLVVIVLIAVSWVLWSVFAAGRGAAAAAHSVAEDNSTETAAHSDERTNLRTVETTEPPGSEALRDPESARPVHRRPAGRPLTARPLPRSTSHLLPKENT